MGNMNGHNMAMSKMQLLLVGALLLCVQWRQSTATEALSGGQMMQAARQDAIALLNTLESNAQEGAPRRDAYSEDNIRLILPILDVDRNGLVSLVELLQVFAMREKG